MARKLEDRRYVSINSAGKAEMITAKEHREQWARLRINPADVPAPWGASKFDSRGRLKLPTDLRPYIRSFSSQE